MSRRKALITQAVLLVLSGLLLWLAMRNVPFGEVAAAVRSISARSLLILAALNASAWCFITLRWWLILYGFGYRLPFLKALRYRMTTFSLSYITPGPQVGGEVLMITYPQTRHGVPSTVGVAAVSVDKALEFVGNFTLIGLGLLLATIDRQFVTESTLPAVVAVLAVLLAPLGLIVTIWRGRFPMSAIMKGVQRLMTPARGAWLRRVPGLRRLPSLPHLQRTVRHIEELIHWLAHHRAWTFVAAMAATLLAMATFTAEFYFMNRTLGIDIGYLKAIGVLMLVYASFLIPLPGGLGAMEAALVTGYTALGYSGAQALSMALVMRVRDIIITVIGLGLGGMDLVRWRANAPAAAINAIATADVDFMGNGRLPSDKVIVQESQAAANGAGPPQVAAIANQGTNQPST